MSMNTCFTSRLGISYPIMLAPMGTVACGELAAAVSNAGGLGMIGAGYADPVWLERELDIVRRKATRPWGVGFITWCLTREVLDLVMDYAPHALMFSFGDMSPWIARVKQKNLPVFSQIHDLAGAFEAREQGADFIVAQGTEAGGHGTGQHATLSLLRDIKNVIDMPVIAAGGIADGRGVAAAIKLGADGVSMGTRFYASFEADVHPRLKRRLVECRAGDTVRTQVFDIIREINWPAGYSGRAINNTFIARWQGNEQRLKAMIKKHQPDFYHAQKMADPDFAIVWAGEGIDVISEIEGAGSLLHRIAGDAEKYSS